MTCQPMRDLDSAPSSSLSPSTSFATDAGEPLIPLVQIQKDGEMAQRFKDGLPLNYGDCTRSVMDTEDRCGACTSFGNGPCLLSNDHENKTSYISSEIAFRERVYERVKNACIRSLSCEVPAPRKSVAVQQPPVSPKKKDPSEGGGVGSSIPLRIQNRSGDNTDRTSITSEELEKKAKEADGSIIFGDNDNGFVFSHTFRLQDAKARGFMRLFSLVVVSNDLTMLTSNFEFFKNSLGAIKQKLQELAAGIYAEEMQTQLQTQLQSEDFACSVATRNPWMRRCIAIETDRNLMTITGKADVFSTLHRQMMWTLRSPILSCHDQVMEGVPTQDMMVLMELDDAAIVELELHHPNQHAVSMQQLSNLKLIARMLMDESERDLELLIKHVVTGGQLVIESSDRSLSRQALLAVSNLLPIGCIKLATYKDVYQPSYMEQFNLLGGPINLDIPLEASDCMVLRIQSNGVYGGDENLSLKGSRLIVRRRPEKTAHRPQLVKRYKDLLLDSEVVDTILDSTLRATREFWMGKAKLCYQMGTQKQMLMLKADCDVFKIITGVTEEDRDVLIFWQAGLSNAYKDHVLASISRPDDQQLPRRYY